MKPRIEVIREIGKTVNCKTDIPNRARIQGGHSEKLLKWSPFDRDEIRRVNGRMVKDEKAESSVSGTET